MTDQFDRFTSGALKVLAYAQDEAQWFNHNYIGTEHLLLGMLREGEGVAARVLTNMGVQLPKVRSAVEFIIGRGAAAVIGEIGLTPRAKIVIDLAIDEVRCLNHNYIGTEHLLLGLMREGEGIAAGVLESLGVNLAKARAHVLLTIDKSGYTSQSTERGRSKNRIYSHKLSARTKSALRIARDEAAQMQHAKVDSGHFLLGFLGEGEGIAARILVDAGVEAVRLRQLVEAGVKRGGGSPEGANDLTRRASAALMQSIRLAERHGDRRVGTGDLLVTICMSEDSISPDIVAAFELDLNQVYRQLWALLND